MKGAFITATGTGVGKTWISTALATACKAQGRRVAAIKPVETGVDPDPLDALELARACHDEPLAHAGGLYRAPEPLAPYSVEKRGGPAVGSLVELARRLRQLAQGADCAIVEGAGGVLVPLDREHTIADLIALLDLQAVVVARNELGVLSYTLTAVEALRSREISVSAIVLNHADQPETPDLSRSSNAEVLSDLLPQIPVLSTAHVQQPAELVDVADELRSLLKL